MEITCPGCETRYEVGDLIVRPGRVVRCARCPMTWLPRPVPETAKQVWPADDGVGRSENATGLFPEPARPSPSPPPAPARAARWLPLAWAASIIVLLLLTWTLVQFRFAIAATWPPSARVYVALGLGIRH